MTRALLTFERLRGTFWVLPALGIAFAIGAALALPPVDDHVTLPDAVSFSGGPDTARTVLQMIATTAVSVAGISFSVIVVALVLASQQLSPRVLRSFQRNPLNQAVLGLFLGTAAFSLYVLGAVGDSKDGVPELSITLAMAMAAISFAVFVIFLHHLVRSLNASAVIRRIAAEGHQAIERPYPEATGGEPSDVAAAEREVRRIVERSSSRELQAPRAGYLVSVEVEKVLRLADRCDGFVEQRHTIGDFTVTGGVLALFCSPQERLGDAGEEIEQAFVLSEERLVDNDIAFPLRQLADVALKGLSPGVNDPTTAENAMDSVADSLVRLARQRDAAVLRCAKSGVPRFRALTPSLDDLVRLGFDQVRRDGAKRPSFAVRLLELLAQVRDLGGPRAASCREIGEQARAVRDHAIALAEVPADAELIRGAYERLHAFGAPPAAEPVARGQA